MKRRGPTQVFPGLIAGLLLLFAVSASAARLEADHEEIEIGEVTTVHLKGTPFIALVDWKVGPELEILDSDKNHARVRGVRAGTGKVMCEMNLRVHTLDIAVRALVPATPAEAPPSQARPVYTTPSPPPPTYTPPAYSPPVAAPQSELVGDWRIDANGYTGKLELSSTQGMLIGRVWFDAHGVWEPLEEMYFDSGIGELSFTRPGANQTYRGRFQNDKLEGRFTQWSGHDYSTNAPTYPWSANRTGTTAVASATSAPPARITELGWMGTDEDKVGEWDSGRPNGAPDGHFRLVADLPDKQTMTSISLWSADAQGGKAGGHIWHSKNGGYWMLGVFRDGRQLNASHVASLGDFSGNTVFDLYANSSGLFNPGQTFLVEVETGDGKVLSRTLTIEAQTSAASLKLTRDRYAPGETIVVNFTAPEGYASNAWIGIIPSRVPHGSEAENDRHDLSYQYLQKRVSGDMTFIAPKEAGDYDLRMHDTDSNGREVAAVSFRVDAAR
jgi:hypothetical protein